MHTPWIEHSDARVCETDRPARYVGHWAVFVACTGAPGQTCTLACVSPKNVLTWSRIWERKMVREREKTREREKSREREREYLRWVGLTAVGKGGRYKEKSAEPACARSNVRRRKSSLRPAVSLPRSCSTSQRGARSWTRWEWPGAAHASP